MIYLCRYFEDDTLCESRVLSYVCVMYMHGRQNNNRVSNNDSSICVIMCCALSDLFF